MKKRWRLGNFGKLVLCILATPFLVILSWLSAQYLYQLKEIVKFLWWS